MSQPIPSADFLQGALADHWLADAVAEERATAEKNTANSPCCPKAE